MRHRISSRRIVLSLAPITCLALIAALLPSASAQQTAAPEQTQSSVAHAPDPAAQTTPQLAFTQAANTGEPVLVDTETTYTSQTWANPDGTFTAEIASGPVRVPDLSSPDGWTPIDTTLQATPDGIQPAATVADITFSDGGNDPMASLDIGKRSLDQSWPDPLPAPTLEKDTATLRLQCKHRRF